jgi:hypothetical protein
MFCGGETFTRNVMSGRMFTACLASCSSVANENAIVPFSHAPALSGPTPRGDLESRCHGECRVLSNTARLSILTNDPRCAAELQDDVRRYLSIGGQFTAGL